MRTSLGAWRNRLAPILSEPLLRLAARLLPRTIRPTGADALLRLAGEASRLPLELPPASAESRRALEVWFAVHDVASRKIGLTANTHYDGRHPKHHLWQEHNRYLYDAVQPGDRVLDVGCGASHYPQWIAEKAEEVVGVDILPDRIELARRLNARENVRYELMDVTREIPPGGFDLAICSHCLEHLDDPTVFLAAIAKRVPRIVVKVPLADSHWMKLVRKEIGLPWMDDADHRREYDEPLLRRQLEEAGWQIEELIRGYDLRARAVSRSLEGAAPDPGTR